MIAIAPPIYSSTTLVSTAGTATLDSASRRARRVATLDGGAVLSDQGWSAADLIYQIRIPDADGSTHRTLTNLLQVNGSMILSCSRGCYLVLLSALTFDRNTRAALITAEVLEDLS